MSNSFFHPMPKAARFRSRKYLDFIAHKPCVRCGRYSDPEKRLSDPHHERKLGDCGVALKPDDSVAVPLCHSCHVMRDYFRGPVFHRDGDSEESFYPPHVDLKLKIIGYLTEFIDGGCR